MLQETRTLELFSYSIDLLTKGSNKKVCVKCDYCNSEYEVPYKAYINSRKVVEKDSCKKCKYNKRKDISLKLYGVENSAQRDDVRKKISEKCEGFDEKRKATIRRKYGTEHALQNINVQEKQRQTMLDRYGVEYSQQSKDLRAKTQQTNLEKYGREEFLASDEGKQRKLYGVRNKYGVDNVFQAEEIKEKIKETNLNNLGVEYPMQSKEVLDKSHKTNLERYGVENVFQNEDVKQKIYDTNMERYGVGNPLQNNEIKQKAINTNIEKYGYEHPTQSDEIKQKIIETKKKKGIIKLLDGKDMKTVAQETNKAYSTLVVQVRKFGFKEARLMSPKMTNIEYMMKLWLDEQHIKYKTQFVIGKKRADFLLTDYNIIVEVDGLYWHSDANRPDNYHVKKHQFYVDNNYRPFFFREHELNDQFEIVKSILSNTMGNSNKIFARKCEIIKLSREQATNFFAANHLMGVGVGKTYGLKYNNDIVSAIMIKRTRNKNYEISRFCHALNTQVVGGFSKLVKHFCRNNDYDTLTTFIDKRYGAGSYLPELNFELKSCFTSFKWTDGEKVYNRLRFPSNTGYKYGLLKLWDCGQAKYVFSKS